MYIGAGDGGTHTLIYSSPDAGLSYWMLGTESIDANGVHFNPSAQGPIDFGGVYSAKVSLAAWLDLFVFTCVVLSPA